jgi:MOSC domain-containing protein YiiM
MKAAKTACVSAIYISPVATRLPEPISEVRAVSGAGLEGDRYCSGEGTWSHWPGGGRQITLIESEVVAALEQSIGISAAQTRRNIVTRGVRLNDLVGLDFTIGEVLMRGVRLCEPCAHLEKLTVRGAALALDNCGGLRADILRGGIIRLGNILATN